MDIQGQIRGKREAAARVRQLAMVLSGDCKIDALVFAAQLEVQASTLEGLAAPSPRRLSEPGGQRPALAQA